MSNLKQMCLSLRLCSSGINSSLSELDQKKGEVNGKEWFVYLLFLGCCMYQLNYSKSKYVTFAVICIYVAFVMEMASQSFILASIIKQFIKLFQFSQAVPIQMVASHDALE